MIKILNFIFLRFWNYYTHTSLKFFLNKNKKKSKNLKKFKIIFVKPLNYLDLYPMNIKKNFLQVLNSNYRMGPVGLFLDHETDFVISSTYNDILINYNLQKYKLNKLRMENLRLQWKNRKDINKIDFNKYDLAISFEDTISNRIVNKYKKVLWFKIYEDHKKNCYKKNLFFKPKFYDGILNQTLGFTPYNLFSRRHSIDFSYTFGNSNFLKKVKKNNSKKIDIIIEVNQENEVKKKLSDLIKKNLLRDINNVHFLDENLSHNKYISKLSKGIFFIATNSKSPRWGNSLLEAAICQNLIIGNRNHFWNSQIIIKELHSTNLNHALKIVNKLKKNEILYKKYLQKQNDILDYLNYFRPIQQIKNYSTYIKRDLNLNRKN